MRLHLFILGLTGFVELVGSVVVFGGVVPVDQEHLEFLHGRHRVLHHIVHFLATPPGLLHEPLDVSILRGALDLAALARLGVSHAFSLQPVALEVEFGDVAHLRVDHLARQ